MPALKKTNETSPETQAMKLLNQLKATMDETLVKADTLAKNSDYTTAISDLTNLETHYTAKIKHANRIQNPDTDAMAEIKTITSELFKKYRRNVYSYAQEQLKVDTSVAEKKLKKAEKKVIIQSASLETVNKELAELKSIHSLLQRNDANIKANNHQIQLNMAHKAVADAKAEILSAQTKAATYKDPDGPAKAVAVAEAKATAEAKEAKATAEQAKQEIIRQRRNLVNEFTDLVTILDNHVKELANINPPKFQSKKAAEDYANASRVGSTLVTELNDLSKKFLKTLTMTNQDFKNASKNLIAAAKPTLEKQPGFTDLINEILFWVTNVLSIGIVPLVARITTDNARFGFFTAKPMEAGVAATKIETRVAGMG